MAYTIPQLLRFAVLRRLNTPAPAAGAASMLTLSIILNFYGSATRSAGFPSSTAPGTRA